jgi:hypothetical protein
MIPDPHPEDISGNLAKAREEDAYRRVWAAAIREGERDAFEAEMRKIGWNDFYDLEWDNDDYGCHDSRVAWQAWRARAALCDRPAVGEAAQLVKELDARIARQGGDALLFDAARMIERLSASTPDAASSVPMIVERLAGVAVWLR